MLVNLFQEMRIMSQQQQQQYGDMKTICYFKSHADVIGCVFIILRFTERMLFVMFPNIMKIIVEF